MSFSLHKLKKNKSGQGSLVGVILASVIGTIIVGATTAWYLSMNRNMTGTNDRLEAMTIAMSEWQRLEHMSLDELEDNRENYKTPYAVGDKFKVGVNLGEQGFFDEGKCNSLTGDYAKESANCFKDTIMTVYDKDGYALYTTRSLPLSAGSGADNFPEGTILAYTGDLAEIPKGWVLCDGNNGTPDLRGRFLEGTVTTTGEFKMAGLPNITGNIMHINAYGHINSGALYQHAPDVLRVGQGGGAGLDATTMFFDASRSNPIYGRSDIVQPSSFTVFYIMKTNTDFHYSHTNGFVSPNYYTKEEIDQMLADERDRVSNNYYTKSQIDLLFDTKISNLMAIGTILPYKGDLSKIPENWALCDGTNGTPDLRNRFLTGAGSTYAIGATGGENFHTLTIDEMPSHNHPFSNNGNLYAVEYKITHPDIVTGYYDRATWAYIWAPLSSLMSGYTGGNQAHENRPPFYAVYYIMKIK